MNNQTQIVKNKNMMHIIKEIQTIKSTKVSYYIIQLMIKKKIFEFYNTKDINTLKDEITYYEKEKELKILQLEITKILKYKR